MKNERIITHFQSYTTALGCVKDLTPYFSGKISIITSKEGLNRSDRDPTADENTTTMNDTVVDEIGEIGGITLGTAAYLIPGLSPVLVGGPIAGMAMGDAISAYILGGMDEDEDEDDLETRRETPYIPDRSGAGRNGRERYFVIVDVDSEEEADLAASIMQRHSAKCVRQPRQQPEPDRQKPQTDFADPCEVERYDRMADYPNTLEAPWDQREPEGAPPATGIYHNPNKDGYTLDPIAPFTPQGWIDVNVGFGSYDNVDPTGLTHDHDVEEDTR
jgi:hypothetical protein